MSFSQLCRPKSRILSPERKKEIATQLNNEGFNCKNGDRVSIPGVGLNLTKRECYELAVSMDPTLAEAFYNLGNAYYVTDDACTHGPGSLSEGCVAGETIECDFHNGVFNIRTGEVVAPPCMVSLRTFETAVVGEKVFINPAGRPLA